MDGHVPNLLLGRVGVHVRRRQRVGLRRRRGGRPRRLLPPLPLRLDALLLPAAHPQQGLDELHGEGRARAPVLQPVLAAAVVQRGGGARAARAAEAALPAPDAAGSNEAAAVGVGRQHVLVDVAALVGVGLAGGMGGKGRSELRTSEWFIRN